jgi:N-methylhydantoinase A
VGATARAGIDIGGTFTDAVLVDRARRLHVAKVRTTPADLAGCFADALQALAESAGVAPAEIGSLVHGSTVAANALVEGRTARVGLLTTEGFRDVLEIGTQQRPVLYDLRARRPPPLVPRDLRLEARGRIGPAGEEVEPLEPADVEAAARAFAAAGIESVAVCFLFSFANPAHEEQAARILQRALPAIPVSLSSRVAPEFREYLRTSTTVVNAALAPLVSRYVERVAAAAREAGVPAPLQLMQSNGGVATVAAAARTPVALAASGPAAGVIGAARLGALVSARDLLTFDMGGTTADVGLVVGGRPQLRFRGDAAGHPVNLPQIDVLSVGAGGGSIARVDRFGSLRVGPQSAGADPGPAAYGTGGEEATVTDAHVVLGALDPERFLGGRMRLDRDAARRAVERRVARPLGLSVEEAAAAVLRIADAAMVRALRVISVARGNDPRRFALVAFGGAGPMHACAIAEELHMTRVLVPRYPGVGSALGLLLSDVRYDLRRTWLRRVREVRARELASVLAGLEREARELLDAAGHADGRGQVEFELDMRYRGQAYELTVPLPAGAEGGSALARAESAFHNLHRKAYGHSSPVDETEIVTVRAHATARSRLPALDGAAAAVATVRHPARTVRTAAGRRRFAVVERDALQPGEALRGPAIVEQDDSTVVVSPGWRLAAGPAGTAALEREARR